MVRTGLIYNTRAHAVPEYQYEVTLIEETPLEGARRVVARIENESNGVEYFLGAFSSQRLAIEGVFAQINGLTDHPVLQDLQDYPTAMIDAYLERGA